MCAAGLSTDRSLTSVSHTSSSSSSSAQKEKQHKSASSAPCSQTLLTCCGILKSRLRLYSKSELESLKGCVKYLEGMVKDDVPTLFKDSAEIGISILQKQLNDTNGMFQLLEKQNKSREEARKEIKRKITALNNELQRVDQCLKDFDLTPCEIVLSSIDKASNAFRLYSDALMSGGDYQALKKSLLDQLLSTESIVQKQHHGQKELLQKSSKELSQRLEEMQKASQKMKAELKDHKARSQRFSMTIWDLRDTVRFLTDQAKTCPIRTDFLSLHLSSESPSPSSKSEASSSSSSSSSRKRKVTVLSSSPQPMKRTSSKQDNAARRVTPPPTLSLSQSGTGRKRGRFTDTP